MTRIDHSQLTNVQRYSDRLAEIVDLFAAAPNASFIRKGTSNLEYAQLTIQPFVNESLTISGAGQVTFTLSAEAAGASYHILFVNGIRAHPTADYSISSTTLTWLNAMQLAPGDRLVFAYMPVTAVVTPPPTFDTTLNAAGIGVAATAAGVTLSAAIGDVIRFNARSSGASTPATMEVFAGSTQVAEVVFFARYLGDRFSYTHGGVTYLSPSLVFTSGAVTLA